MDFEQADIKYTIFFGADHRLQSCRPSSAMLPTIVGSAADHRQHQEKLSRKLLDSLVCYFDFSNIRYKQIHYFFGKFKNQPIYFLGFFNFRPYYFLGKFNF